jgi:hypothetical protein
MLCGGQDARIFAHSTGGGSWEKIGGYDVDKSAHHINATNVSVILTGGKRVF